MLRFDRRVLYNFDWVTVLLLALISIMALASLFSSTWNGGPGPSPLFIKQLYFFLFGYALILLILSVDYSELEMLAYVGYGVVCLLLVYTKLFVKSVAGSQRWIDLGFFKLQPSEPTKLVLVLILASCFARLEAEEEGYGLRDLIRPVTLTAVPFLLIVIQPDLGTALMLAFVFVSMTLFSRLRWPALASLGITGLITVVLGWLYGLKPYQRRRIETFLNPESDPMNHGYQIKQSKIAVGSGHFFGKGFMEGTQGHLNFLPERHTDFAFAVWCEELGFVGSVFYLLCYFLLLLWGINIALSARDKFGVYLAFGIVMLIFWQATVNLFMITGMLPVVGVPLPMFSYGGSSLLTNLAAVGILMNIRMRRFQKR
ncbi:rod shape-determining protein RodA [Candidatus Electronema sp. PJ]|uniref:rod shape-determining protein RodA n=1 Tax=Candidatus Electronema sp. PJ TaxID=3401572 RepID=UPI003AA92A2B